MEREVLAFHKSTPISAATKTAPPIAPATAGTRAPPVSVWDGPVFPELEGDTTASERGAGQRLEGMP